MISLCCADQIGQLQDRREELEASVGLEPVKLFSFTSFCVCLIVVWR